MSASPSYQETTNPKQSSINPSRFQFGKEKKKHQSEVIQHYGSTPSEVHSALLTMNHQYSQLPPLF